MMSLRVHLAYTLSSGITRNGTNTALPFSVLDERGTVLAESAALAGEPRLVELRDRLEEAYVRLSWPSGRSQTQRVVFSALGTADAVFSEDRPSSGEWSAWAAPRLSKRRSGPVSDGGPPPEIHLDRYAKVWLRFWSFTDGEWEVTRIRPDMQYKSDEARQLDVALPSEPHLLQIGGLDVPWQFVALPSGGPCRIFITPNPSGHHRSGPLRVLVTSFRAGAEMLLEFIARDSMHAASAIADSQALALRLFEDKFEDPFAAVAGAYFLLRTTAWESVPLEWWSNLRSHFIEIADTSIVFCVRMLRGGLSDKNQQILAMQLFRSALDCGWPVYEEGLQLLKEASALLKYIASPKDLVYLSRVDALVTASAWAGASLSFHGLHPSRPSAVLWAGMPGEAVRWQPPTGRQAVAGPEPIAAPTPLLGGAPAATNILSALRHMSSASFVTDLESPAAEHDRLPGSEQRADMLPGQLTARPPPIRREAGAAKSRNAPEDFLFLGDIGT